MRANLGKKGGMKRRRVQVRREAMRGRKLGEDR